ncbi:TRAP transporter large permease subunit [Nocardioides insulae]|uniref:TRAP transporter large permease subunit n=1 Tax=Nocardioides insulae TaxID=394734 RepID=UPI0004059169|nr:TRAP transporter large permease subunit [Nocardioides insulae]
MIGVWALVIYLAVILAWTTLLRRNVGEAMILGFLVAALFNGTHVFSAGWEALYAALTDEIVYATVVFVFMGFLLERAGVTHRMINLLDAAIGRRRGGAAYVSTLASAGLGSIVHNQAAIAATVGSVTIPWMDRVRIDRTTAATIVAGNAGMGITFPFSASMFVLVGSSATGAMLDLDDLIVPLLVGGLWCVLHRLIVTFIFVRRSLGSEAPMPTGQSLRVAFRAGWPTILLFVGIAVPMVLTTGAVGEALTDHTGLDVAEAVSPIFWMPVILIIIGLVLGRGQLPTSPAAWLELIGSSAPRFGIVGVTVLFAFAGANALATTGLPEQLSGILNGLDLPVWLLAVVIGIIVIAVAAPLSSTATMAAVGTVGVAALVAAGVPATTAAVAVLIFSSCEAAVPPGGAPLYVACGIAGVNPLHTFRRMLTYYALPLLGIGVMVAAGVIPV